MVYIIQILSVSYYVSARVQSMYLRGKERGCRCKLVSLTRDGNNDSFQMARITFTEVLEIFPSFIKAAI